MQVPNTTGVIQSRPLDIRISAVYLERELYDNYPPFQRNKVWPDKMKSTLIDSILRGFYIPAILVCQREEGGYWVIDGQQRLSTVFEFMSGSVTTGHLDSENEPGYTPIEARRTYDQLTTEARERFKAYPLRFLILDNVQENMLGVMFRRLQNQIPLSTAEKLWSYTSEATKAAVMLSEHPLFAEMYTGGKRRKQTFQTSLYALFIEAGQGYTNIDLKRLASGGKDTLITPSLLSEVQRRLDLIHYLYRGATFTVMAEMIMLYQSVLLLERAGFNLHASEEGCLTPFHTSIVQQNLLGLRNGSLSVFLQMSKTSYQRQFWMRELLGLASMRGLHAPDMKHAYIQADRIVAYTKQNYICIGCGKSVKLSELDKHAFRDTDIYSKTLHTCAHEARIQQRELVTA